MNLFEFIKKSDDVKESRMNKELKDAFERLINKIDWQNYLLKEILERNGYVFSDSEESNENDLAEYVLRTEFLRELLETGYISNLYAKDTVAINVEEKNFDNYLRRQGVMRRGEYLSQIKKLYTYAIERGIIYITERDLFDFQHEFGDYRHSVRHSTVNYFVDFLEDTPYYGGVNLLNEGLVHNLDEYYDVNWDIEND